MSSKMLQFVTSATAAATFGAMLLAAAPAFAGECAPDKMKEGARSTGETMPKNVKDEVISTVDLTSKGKEFAGYMLRMRRITLEPDGVVPWHTHDKRAANILILEGTVIEYRSDCAGKIVHTAGDVVPEFGPALGHWWRNESDTKVVIISGDLLPPDMPPDDMM